ncbi:hypothetical protein M0R45_019927 [Rubus argutus]|uniref:Uncharacterized protein n=1 Tax=Rubus argutus TaxID=59490 RepID=A0AAW1XA79_RUBAR
MGFDQEHIVMLPFLALGHLIPFLALAKQIQHRTGFRITIATTPLNAQYLRLAAQPNNNIPLRRAFPSSAKTMACHLTQRTLRTYLQPNHKARHGNATSRKADSPPTLTNHQTTRQAAALLNLRCVLRVGCECRKQLRHRQCCFLHLRAYAWRRTCPCGFISLIVTVQHLQTMRNSSFRDSQNGKNIPGKNLEFRPRNASSGWTSHASDSVVYISFGSMNTISSSQMIGNLAIGLEKEREALCLGHKADCRARAEGRVPT